MLRAHRSHLRSWAVAMCLLAGCGSDEPLTGVTAGVGGNAMRPSEAASAAGEARAASGGAAAAGGGGTNGETTTAVPAGQGGGAAMDERGQHGDPGYAA